jgi:threonine synthase
LLWALCSAAEETRLNPALNPKLRQVRCSLSGKARPFAAAGPLGLCDCCSPAKPLILDYEGVAAFPPRGSQPNARRSNALLRYASWLPVSVPEEYGAGVGLTECEPEPRLSDELGCRISIKYEHTNPSGSFKDRGLSVAVALGAALGARRFCLPTQGNAGIAAALFSARLGLPPACVWMPKSHEGNYYHQAAQHFGAEVTLHGRHIAEAGQAMREKYRDELGRGELVDLSTFFEPGRLEGKKTLGLEIAERYPSGLPDVIVYPTGGGTGLVGIWKAFEELRARGELLGQLPRMVAVQAEGCAPVVEAFDARARTVTPVESRGTAADGLNVPGAIMGHEMLRVLYDSNGCAVAVGEAELERDFARLGSLGVPAGFESAATLSALRRLLHMGFVSRDSHVLLLFTSGPAAAWQQRGAVRLTNGR